MSTDDWEASRRVPGSGWAADAEAEKAARPHHGPRYEAGEHLHTGGMGRVEAVMDVVLGRRVARKTVAPEASGSVGARALLEREARIAAQLEHPNIVPIYDVGTTDDAQPYYTMRLVRGRSLAEVLQAGVDRACGAAARVPGGVRGGGVCAPGRGDPP